MITDMLAQTKLSICEEKMFRNDKRDDDPLNSKVLEYNFNTFKHESRNRNPLCTMIYPYYP